ILFSSPLPSIGQTYSLVIQDEKQKEIHTAPAYPGESGSFLATNQQGNGRRFNENQEQKGGFDPRKNVGICTYCKKPGHTIDKCYRIHGVPADFKFTKQRKFQENVQANDVFNTNEEGIQGNMNVLGTQSLTQENVTQLLQLLQQVNIGQQGAETSEASVNLSCAGIAKIFNSFACFIQIDSESWILDSGETEHMTFNINFFVNYKALPKPVMV
ncbi:hypothetical protein A4A49_57624, partial [Nicotiana attenuata]